MCMVPGVTRISHARGKCGAGRSAGQLKSAPASSTSRSYAATGGVAPMNFIGSCTTSARRLRRPLNCLSFNPYLGPERPDLLIVTCGSGWLYSHGGGKNSLSRPVRRYVLKLGHDVAPAATAPADAICHRPSGDAGDRRGRRISSRANLKEFVVDNLPGHSLQILRRHRVTPIPMG